MTKENEMHWGFFSPDEITASKSFISNGYVLCDVDDVDGLQKIQNHIAQSAAAILGLPCVSPLKFLNTIHDQISQARLNEFRVQVINSINLEDWMRPTYYRVARPMLDALVGNEIAMQLRLNLSIQLPGDDSSLLPMHADVWSGDSPFEVVAWLPLVDCFGTKSMYILPPAAADALNNSGFADRIKGKKDLFDAIKNEVTWLEVPYGRVLIFNQNLPHGNHINDELETRWSMNCRFKSVFSPYGDKKLGEFFEPISLRAASRLGMKFKFPRT